MAASSALLLLVPIIINRRNIEAFYHNHRGISGLLRYIWVGDYLPLNIRQSMNALDDVKRMMMDSTKEMEQIGIIIDDQQTMQQHHEGRNPQSSLLYSSSFERVHPKLRTRIALYSYTLDTLASSIDSIMSYNDDDVKSRKKSLSNTIVQLMDDLDKLLSSSSSSSFR